MRLSRKLAAADVVALDSVTARAFPSNVVSYAVWVYGTSGRRSVKRAPQPSTFRAVNAGREAVAPRIRVMLGGKNHPGRGADGRKDANKDGSLSADELGERGPALIAITAFSWQCQRFAVRDASELHGPAHHIRKDSTVSRIARAS